MSLDHKQLQRVRDYPYMAEVVVTDHDLRALAAVNSDWAWKLESYRADVPWPIDDMDLTTDEMTRADFFTIRCYDEGFYPKNVLAKVEQEINSQLGLMSIVTRLRFGEEVVIQLKSLRSKIQARIR